MEFLDRIVRRFWAEKKYRQARAFQRTGSYREAESLYREIIRSDPSFHKAFASLGTLILTNLSYQDTDFKNRLSEGTECLNKAVEIKPDDSESLYHLGRFSYMHLEDEDKAFDLFARAIIADPRSGRRIAEYLNRYSYHTKNDLKKIMDRSIHLASQKNGSNQWRPVISGVSDVLKIIGSIFLLVFVASLFVFPVCEMMSFRDTTVATLLLLLAIIGGIIGVITGKTAADRILNLLFSVLFIAIYYRVIMGCYHP
jgi:tetratricopeptide (TPR) repeat protein